MLLSGKEYVLSCNAACPVYGIWNPGLFLTSAAVLCFGYYYLHFYDLAFAKGTEQKSIVERLRKLSKINTVLCRMCAENGELAVFLWTGETMDTKILQ